VRVRVCVILLGTFITITNPKAKRQGKVCVCCCKVLAMCFVRKGLDYIFTRHELKWLDDIIPESHKREKEERKKRLLASAVGMFAEVRFVQLNFLHCIHDWTEDAGGVWPLWPWP